MFVGNTRGRGGGRWAGSLEIVGFGEMRTEWAESSKSVTIYGNDELLEVLCTAKHGKLIHYFDCPFKSRMRTDSKRK